MKAAFPIDETKKQICVSFGRAPYFLLCDLETGNRKLETNPAADAQGGAGLKAAQFIVDSGAEVLVTVRCGENAAQVFKAGGVSVFEAQGLDIDKNLSALEEKKLPELTRFHAGYHGLR